MTRRFQLTPDQAAALHHNVTAAEDLEALGLRRLAAFFPALTQRLEKALATTRAQRRNAAIACRHYLSAEALVEVLEKRIEEGRGRKGDVRGEIIDEYTQLVPQKLLTFTKRPAAEQRAIQKAYPEVDLRLVRRALREEVLEPEFFAGVLEDPVDYQALLRKLGSASGQQP